jgi:hypothetical protein
VCWTLGRPLGLRAPNLKCARPAAICSTIATLDGKDYPVKGPADYDSVAIKRIDANTRINIYKKGGNVVSMYRSVVSKDGKTLSVDQIGYNAQGVAFHNVIVNDKQ